MSERISKPSFSTERDSGFYPRRAPDEIVGAGGGLRSVLERAHALATEDGPVVILGERGAGRETVARAMHSRSRRGEGAFVSVSARSISLRELDTLLHRAGEGRGYVYIDEVAAMPRDVQRALAVALRANRMSAGARAMNRVVVSSSKEFSAASDAGGVEEELFYEISRSPIRVPSLRERLSDIPALAELFVRRASESLGVQAAMLSPTDLEVLCTYEWQGNVRELALVIERAVLLGGGHGIDIARALGREPKETSEPESLNGAMVKRIERALARTSGRIEGPRGAAAELGINPHTLRARMRKLGIDWARFRPSHT